MHPADVIAAIFIGTVMIILTSSLAYYIVTRAKAKWKNNPAQIHKLDSFEARIQAIESRLTDIQDIVLSIDDQLKRRDFDRINASQPSNRDFA